MGTTYILQTSIDRAEAADSLAKEMVASGLAACVQISAGGHSFFSWKGKVERAEERFLLIKTSGGKLEQAVAWLRAHHPYEVPEILWWECTTDSAYGDWVQNVLHGERN